jgi:hypothetical protein
MKKATDAAVDPGDLMAAINEIKRGEGPKIMRRLCEREPSLAIYIEGIAAHLTNADKPLPKGREGMEQALDAILTIVRAIEIGHFRMWRDSVLPSSPLARLMDLGPQDKPKK